MVSIQWEPDPQVERIVAGWPLALDASHATALGFAADTGIDEVVRAFIEDDLEIQKALI
jgi:D-erythronate 2-dehydrogenase